MAPDSADLGTQPSFWELVVSRADVTPDEPMLVDEREERLTFAGYRQLAERVAAGLQRLGVRPGGRVSWQLPTTIEAAVLIGALARLGVSQNPILPSLRQVEVAFIAGEVKPDLLIAPGEWRGFDHAALAQAIGVPHLVCDLAPPDARSFTLPVADSAELPPPATHPAARWIFYSSGTTGTPKGVLHSDSSVMATPSGLIERARLTASDVYAMPFPITHIGGPTMLAAQLRVGFEMMLVHTFDPAATTAWFAQHGLSVLGMAPPFFNAYLDVQRLQPDRRLFPRARVGVSGGAVTPPDLHAQVRDELGGAGIITVYGMTECPIATCPSIDDSDEKKALTSGFPGPGVQLRIAGGDGHPAPPGTEGEILVKAPQMLVGYIDPAFDEAAFDADGFLRSGDLGALDADGYLQVTGRIKDVIIRNAENISAAEVEAVLQEHPAVAEVSVIGLPDARTGERVCAVLVLAPGATKVELPDIAAFCHSKNIASFKIPEQLEVRSCLPLTPMGKVAKRELVNELSELIAAAQ